MDGELQKIGRPEAPVNASYGWITLVAVIRCLVCGTFTAAYRVAWPCLMGYPITADESVRLLATSFPLCLGFFLVPSLIELSAARRFQDSTRRDLAAAFVTGVTMLPCAFVAWSMAAYAGEMLSTHSMPVAYGVAGSMATKLWHEVGLAHIALFAAPITTSFTLLVWARLRPLSAARSALLLAVVLIPFDYVVAAWCHYLYDDTKPRVSTVTCAVGYAMLQVAACALTDRIERRITRSWEPASPEAQP